jgi:hypothetical protein
MDNHLCSTISIDNTSGCQLYLSKKSLEASITTTKSSEINALIPDANGDDDWMRNDGISLILLVFVVFCMVVRMTAS